MKKLTAIILCLMLTLVMAVGCAAEKPEEAPAPEKVETPAEKPAEKAPAEAAPAEFDPSKHKLGFVNDLGGHFVHQTLRYAFQTKAEELGYEYVPIVTSGTDWQELASMVMAAIADGVTGIAFWSDAANVGLMSDATEAGAVCVNMGFEIPKDSGAQLVASLPFKSYDYGQLGAEKMVGKLKADGIESGTIGISQGSFNTTENNNAQGFIDYIKKNNPEYTCLEVIEEGFETSTAQSKIVALIQANADTIVGGYTTTGNGAINWCAAADSIDMKGKLVIIGEDYSSVTLGLVESGELYGFMAEPLIEVATCAAETLDKALRGEEVEYFEYFTTPFVGKEDLAPYKDIVANVEKMYGDDYGANGKWIEVLTGG
ncbi:MAG: substrate-binding domain-containing protein [Christensenellaceae bacterium]|nr:substrate-binding domain-containing protein [Christensenellaceae bacterium]